MKNLKKKYAMASAAILLTCSVLPMAAQANEVEKVAKEVMHYMEKHEGIVKKIDKKLWEAAKEGLKAVEAFCGDALADCIEDVAEIAVEAGSMEAKPQ